MTVNIHSQDSVSWKSQASSPKGAMPLLCSSLGRNGYMYSLAAGITVHCLFGAQNMSDKFRELSPGDPTRTIQLNLGSRKYNRDIGVP